ncbi:MAG TPA: septum formation family protein [Candidatus Corynebacterium gallistercoris]|uniref:Septum formation family protein n=1 Tax=Candidatus Corynebacterium gallistercoris TaxID=2838530 RepID=A0A9D1RX07_9CORY|nr:septum formation family protein [Candidatus Corynebacterium gallistercoris]
MPISQARRRKRARSVSVALTAALCGGVGVGAFALVAPEGSTPLAPSPEKKGEAIEDVSFTSAGTGDCVNWTPGAQGVNTGFTTVDCAAPHRFEVSAREDLAKYPTSEFGPEANQPDLARQEQLTNELCAGPTLKYLEGKLDPEGRYSISPILPPQSAWAEGDRTMLCGVMVQDANGRSVETTGFAAQQDQARVFPADTCVRVDGDVTNEVPCQEEHAWQVTSLVNLGERFPDSWPGVEQQNEYLNEVCTNAARDYLGGDDALYESTLTPFWNTLQQQSWDAGSRSVNCALTYGQPGGSFATLNGDVRQGFTINGQPPAKQPPRNPIRQ